jgi:uncharacterized protein (TIGR03435 family)
LSLVYSSKSLRGSVRVSTVLRLGIFFMPFQWMFGAQAADRVEFEVATIRPSTTAKGQMGVLTYPGGRVNFGHRTLADLISTAFNVELFQISSGPAWARSDEYEIEARPTSSSKSSLAKPNSPKAPLNNEQRKMLQTLLHDRFQLKYHSENRQGPVYFLLKGNKRLRLEKAHTESDFSWVGGLAGGMIVGDGVAGTSVSMPTLAERLSRYMGRPVLDRTGITGLFDFKYAYNSDDPKPDVISTIITSMQEIGLKLESAVGPVETIVIDHAEKPSPN